MKTMRRCATIPTDRQTDTDDLKGKKHEGDIDALFAVSDKLSPVEWNLFNIYGINRDRGEAELRRFLLEKDLNPDYFNGMKR